MKRLILFSAIIIWGFQSDLLSQQYITPQQLGLKISKGNIDKSKMSSFQKDTILINQFTPLDVFLDIAVLYKTRNELVIYKNLGNGFLDTLKITHPDKPVIKIESTISDKLPFFIPRNYGIKLIYNDASEYLLSNRYLNSNSPDDFTISKAQ